MSIVGMIHSIVVIVNVLGKSLFFHQRQQWHINTLTAATYSDNQPSFEIVLSWKQLFNGRHIDLDLTIVKASFKI